MEARLIRVEETEAGALGVLLLDGEAFCVTLEPPDKDNQRDVSCIPVGRYRCSIVESPRYGTTFEVTDVPGRSHILLHPGNVVSDTKGCILLGQNFGKLSGNRAVLNSGKTFQNFMVAMSGLTEFMLTIDDATSLSKAA